MVRDMKNLTILERVAMHEVWSGAAAHFKLGYYDSRGSSSTRPRRLMDITPIELSRWAPIADAGAPCYHVATSICPKWTSCEAPEKSSVDAVADVERFARSERLSHREAHDVLAHDVLAPVAPTIREV